MNKLALAYSQKYHHNLALASLGYKTIPCLVAALKRDLMVMGKLVFHKSHQPHDHHGVETSAKLTKDGRPAMPQRNESPIERKSFIPSASMPQVDGNFCHVPSPQVNALLGPPLISTAALIGKHLPVNPPFNGSKPAERLSQQQCQRVVEVSHAGKIFLVSLLSLFTFISIANVSHFDSEAAILNVLIASSDVDSDTLRQRERRPNTVISHSLDETGAAMLAKQSNGNNLRSKQDF